MFNYNPPFLLCPLHLWSDEEDCEADKTGNGNAEEYICKGGDSKVNDTIENKNII